MSNNLSGWSLTARLINKHFGVLGSKVAETIANWDPETATEADRDNLQARLAELAKKLAVARDEFNKEHNDVVALERQIANDEKALDVLADRLEKGQIDEATVQMFLDELEAEKARLPQEQQEEQDAKAFLDEVQSLVDMFSKQLADFDAAAKKAKQALASAKAQKELQDARLARQEELRSFQGGISSTALGALNRRADAMRQEAAGARIVADIQQKPLDQAKSIDDIRKSVAAGATAGESAMDRLKRLRGTQAA